MMMRAVNLAPARRPSALTQVAAFRDRIEAAVERLITLLDKLDADPDLEPAGDEEEPWLGLPEAETQARWTNLDDREQDAGDECEPDDDGEPDVDGEYSCQAPRLGLEPVGHEGGWLARVNDSA